MITFRKLQHSITGTVNGKPFSVARTEDNIKYLEVAQKDGFDVEEFNNFVSASRKTDIASKNKYLSFNPVTNEYYLELDGKRSPHAVPKSLVKFIEDSHDKDIDFMPVVKAWARLLSNPRYNPEMGRLFGNYLSTNYVDWSQVEELEEEGLSREAAREASTYPDIAITQEGLLATYKVASLVTWEYEMVYNEETESYEKKKKKKYADIADKIDPTTGETLEKGGFEKPESLEDFLFTPAIHTNGDKFFSGDKIGYVYQVGKVQHLPASARRNLSNTFGGGGLYIGGLNYIENYRSSGTHVLTCFVNPADILSFQSDGQAIRVDALMPNNVWDETIPLKGTYHSSEYGKTSEARVDEIVKDAIARGVDLVEEQRQNIGEI